jgi:hypothetical protein
VYGSVLQWLLSVLNWGLNRPRAAVGTWWKSTRKPWARTKLPDDPNVQIRCQCQGDKEEKEIKTHRDNKEGSRDSSLSSSKVQCAPTEKYSAPFEKGKRRQYCLIELFHKQQIIDNAAERGSRCCGIRGGKRMFKDLWLDQRSAGLGCGGGCI